ncbi:polysaccharide pyruvyl transferase CsaB [Bacillus chungangensis]|uniref:Polysaccharide pyruvyl transferase CsaB n=1 Tax=Bacillus chungangensis TaxID=587633 RepID=A0ABT9WW52_9BACI|nr:polysaccharide pyruvyl transferase CsaB [Bacillus chungangensis]MDQ0177107.1 polysaccharide pyruvyl transferase CsaB [Bacillus chungangensis]
MKVVISGYYGFDNIGDEAILYAIIHALRQQQADVDITVLSNNPSVTETTYDVKAVNRWKLKEVMKAIKHADGFISGGGSLLQDETGFKSIPYYTGIIKLAQWLGKPVFVYAQGMGPIHRGFNKWITKQTLQKAGQITVRDRASKQLLESIGVRKQIEVVPDPVIGLHAEEFHSSWFEAASLSHPVIAVSVRDWPTNVDYKNKIADGLDQCVQQGMEIVFVPMHGEHDDRTSKELAKMMKEKSKIAPYDASIEEKIAIIGKSDVLFAMRLHALIFAAITYTPFIALSYDPKIDAFAEQCSQCLIGHVKEDTWGSADVLKEITRLLANEEAEQQRLRDIVAPLQAAANKTALQAINTFRGSKN